METFFKDLLIEQGGTISIIIACLLFFKNILKKYIDTIIESSADKSIEKLKNKYSRTLTAYDILLKKEFEYYEKIDCIFADLIVDIQDFKSSTINEFGFDIKKRFDIAKSTGLKLLETIINLKKFSLLYQSYIPDNIFDYSMSIIGELQENCDLISDSLKLLGDKQEDKLNLNAIKDFTSKILLLIANTEVSIKTRLQDLSNVPEKNKKQVIIIKRRLNIFIDESGDFGFVDGSSDLYGVSFTIHESDDSIVNDLEYLNNRLEKANYDGMIHLADLVAKRGDYSYLKLEQRKNIFWAIFYFSKRVKVKIHTIIIDKRFKNSKTQLNRELAIEINKFFESISNYMNQFEKVVVYYDNGQEALGAIIDTLLITKNNVEHRIEFDHKEKRLFQVSDMLTFIDKIVYKHNHNIPLTRAEKYFFSVKDILGIIRQLKNKRL